MSTEQPNNPIAQLVAEVKAQAMNAPADAQLLALARINALVANLKQTELESTSGRAG
uniref:hypothetical protein n=1 Tax=Pseudomonas fluorescens TaxID=294 RepID=UPI0018679DFD|nr:hypothetical protein [Pseudomonas fluorescens]